MVVAAAITTFVEPEYCPFKQACTVPYSPLEDEHREEQKVSHSRPKDGDTVDVTRERGGFPGRTVPPLSLDLSNQLPVIS